MGSPGGIEPQLFARHGPPFFELGKPFAEYLPLSTRRTIPTYPCLILSNWSFAFITPAVQSKLQLRCADSKLNIHHSTIISMSDIWDYFKGLFKKAATSSPSQPLIHEMISRSEEEKQDYTFWKNTLVCKRLLNWLNEQYILFRANSGSKDRSVDFLNTPSSKGFVIYFHETRYSDRDIVHFFDFLKEQVLRLNYRTQISDVRTYERSQWVESVQRHYLKPRPGQNEKGQFLQRFGNIMIELTSRNDQLQHLKFRATTYKDYQYQEADPFEKLLQEVLY